MTCQAIQDFGVKSPISVMICQIEIYNGVKKFRALKWAHNPAHFPYQMSLFYVIEIIKGLCKGGIIITKQLRQIGLYLN